MAIYFFNEDISYTLPSEELTQDWIRRVLINEGYTDKNINYVFCSDSHLLLLNKEYLDHHNLTDIITFDNSENDLEVEADIFISIDRVKENAAKFERSFDDEVHRVMIHGLLHILGFEDKTAEQKEGMREKEDACLSLR